MIRTQSLRVLLVAAALLGVPASAQAAPGLTARPTLRLAGAFTVDHAAVTLPGRAVRVIGLARPYVPGQQVTLRAFIGRRRFELVRLGLKPTPRHVFGKFTWTLRSPAVGGVRVVVDHAATGQMRGFERRVAFTALDQNVGFGATGRFVQLLQQRLSALHLFIPQTGVYDAGTGLAVDAYHRLLHRGVSQLLDPGTLSALLDGTGAFRVRFPKQGDHAEGNLSVQLLALIHGSKVFWIFPISSGKPSTPTVLGSWRIYRRTPGYLPDGMYYSSFFTGGYAIHGYNPAPDYPASHGCMRLPILDAIPAFNWLGLGDWVDTYY
jgi:hypothetical protein